MKKHMNRALAFALVFVLNAMLFTACTVNTVTPVPTSNETTEPVITETPTQVPIIPEEKESIFTRDISSESKERALEQIYETAKRSFASWNTFTSDDWKDAYPVALEQVLATDNIYDFYMELKRFTALLNDHHSEVSFPMSFYEELWYSPIEFIYIDGGYYIVGGDSDDLKKLTQFSKIVKIDGVPIDTYMEQNVFPYMWHAKLNTAVSSWGSIFARLGSENTFQSFEVITPEGEIVTADIDRVSIHKPVENWITPKLSVDTVFEEVFSSSLLTIKRIDSDYIYIYIPHFLDQDVVSQFEEHLDELKEARGIIIDVRGNQGGGSEIATPIAGHFIDGVFPDLYAEESVYHLSTDSYTLRQHKTTEKKGVGDITAPIIVLQDYQTFSAGEHFLDFMSSALNAVSMGTESAGATGDPEWVELPENGRARISKYKIYRHDKTPFLNIGIQPDIFVYNSIEDYINGYDRILDSGLAEIKKMCNK